MNAELASALPMLLPAAIQWAESTAAECLGEGVALTPGEVVLARSVGVASPERVRVLVVPEVPCPTDGALGQLAARMDFLGPDTQGLTLGHAIFIRRGHASRRLLSHELRHVHQVEAAGSIAAFLPLYLRQVAEHGYEDAPYERDARAHEV